MEFTTDKVHNLRKSLKALDTNLWQLRISLFYIKSVSLSSCADNGFNELKEICKVILNNVPFMLSLLDTTYITRARQNIKPVFSKESELSHNKDLATVSSGRFNLAGESVFYGCLPTHHENGDLINYRNQCPLFEICKEISTGEGMNFPVFFTLGFWKVIKQLPVLNLCYDEDHLISNPAINKPVNEWITHIKKEASPKTFEFIIEVWRYFSGLTRQWGKDKNPNSYLVLTAFFHAFKETYKQSHLSDCAGIMYPSAMTEAKGLNIVLDPTAVNEHLQLSCVQMYLLRSRGLSRDYEPITQRVPVINSNFVFDKKVMFWYNLAMHNWKEIESEYLQSAGVLPYPGIANP